jgi:hypothetical protein
MSLIADLMGPFVLSHLPLCFWPYAGKNAEAVGTNPDTALGQPRVVGWSPDRPTSAEPFRVVWPWVLDGRILKLLSISRSLAAQNPCDVRGQRIG